MENLVGQMNSFLIPLAALIAGILAAMAGLSIWWGVVGLILSLCLYLSLQFMSRSPSRAYGLAPFHHVWIALLFFGIGIIDYSFKAPETIPEVDLTGDIVAEAEVLDSKSRGSGDRLTVRLKSITTSRSDNFSFGNTGAIVDISTSVVYNSDPICRGDIIRFSSTLTPIEYHPGLNSQSYVSYMRNKGILYSCRVDSGKIDVIGKINSVSVYALDLRERLEIFIETSGLKRLTAHFLITILLGDKEYLDSELRQSFADAGISHMLALSGMHVGIITAIIMAILFPINFTGRYKLRYFLTIVILWIYTLLTGLSPSSVRATIMATFAFSALMLERRKSTFNGLLCSVFVILLFNPLSLMDYGLQLSVVCVGALIAFTEYYNPVDHRSHASLYKLAAIFLSTVIATIGSWALVAFYFGIFSPMFLVANMTVLPLLPFYLVVAIIYLSFSALGIDFKWLSGSLDYLFDCLCRFTSFLSADGSGAIHIHVPIATVALWMIALVILACGIHLKKSAVVRFSAYATMALSIAAIMIFPAKAEDSGFVIRPNVGKVRISSFSGNPSNRSDYEFTQHGIQYASYEDISLMGISDCNLDTLNPQRFKYADYIVIGRNVRGNLGALRGLHPKSVILHNTLYHKAERHLINYSDTSGLRIHSIRRNGPFIYVNK